MEIKPTPILMVSALTRKGSEATFKALEYGAVDFIEKPSGSISLDIRKIGNEIINKVKSVSKAVVRKKQHIAREPTTEKVEKLGDKKTLPVESEFVGELNIPPEKLKKWLL